MGDESNVQSTVQAVRGIVEAVPVYQDVVQPAARELGAGLQTVAKTVHILLAPVAGLVWGYDQIKEFVSARVAEKLKCIPADRLRSPEPNVAGPALEALRYTGHKDELRELFASLIATSMDAAVSDRAHPALVDFIRQMSPDEAMLSRWLASTPAWATYDITKVTPGSGRHWAVRHFSTAPYHAGCARPENGPAYMVSLLRLGLVEVRSSFQLNGLNGFDPYGELRNHEDLKRICAEITQQPGCHPDMEPGASYMTALGRMFATACLS